MAGTERCVMAEQNKSCGCGTTVFEVMDFIQRLIKIEHAYDLFLAKKGIPEQESRVSEMTVDQKRHNETIVHMIRPWFSRLNTKCGIPKEDAKEIAAKFREELNNGESFDRTIYLLGTKLEDCMDGRKTT